MRERERDWQEKENNDEKGSALTVLYIFRTISFPLLPHSRAAKNLDDPHSTDIIML